MSHTGDGGRNRAFAGTHAGQVHHNQVLVLSEQVKQFGVPVVHGGGEVHKHDQRNVRVAFAEFSVGNLLVVDGDVAGGGFEVRHDSSFR